MNLAMFRHYFIIIFLCCKDTVMYYALFILYYYAATYYSLTFFLKYNIYIYIYKKIKINAVMYITD